ncbi:hypothetical protein ACPC2L_33545 [Rhodococcus erythropolis]
MLPPTATVLPLGLADRSGVAWRAGALPRPHVREEELAVVRERANPIQNPPPVQRLIGPTEAVEVSGLDRDQVRPADDQAIRLPPFGGVEVRRVLPCCLGCTNLVTIQL